MATAWNNRWGHRDATTILVAFRHGLRSSELVDLRWDQIDFTHAVLHVRHHPVVGPQRIALLDLYPSDVVPNVHGLWPPRVVPARS